MKTMYDAVTAGNLPVNAEYAAYYTDGMFANREAVQRQCPRAKLLSITVNGGVADACDSETGDLTIPQTIAWVDQRVRDGAWRPCIYANEDRWKNLGLEAALAHYGNRIRRWMAHYDNVGIIPSGYDAKQYATGGVDTNVIADNFFGPVQPPKPADPHHYQWFPSGPFSSHWGDLDERSVVERYDGARKHPVRYFFYLRKLRAQLRFLADRVSSLALREPNKNGKPSWNLFYRGWRFQQLIKRSQGRRFV